MTALRQMLLEPKVVAFVGVSEDPGKLSARPWQFCCQHGFKGRLYIVNPLRKKVLGQTAYPSVSDIPAKVDHVYILLRADLVGLALDDCIAAGVKVVSILADGFAEVGEEGMARQANLVVKANAAGVMLIGPNSMGVVNINAGFVCTTNAAFKTERLKLGRLAVLSQSGSLIGALISRGQARNINFSKLISLGNEAQTCCGTLGSTLVDDTTIDGFLLFLETIRNPDKFALFASEAKRRGKPIVAYVLGKSQEGQSLSILHTGAMTGEADAISAFLAHHNIAEVDQFDALLEAPALLMKKEKFDGRPRCATVITTTGGGGAMVVDQLGIRGVKISGLSASSRRFFRDQNIPHGSGKLVDVTLAGAQYEIMKPAISQLIKDKETGLIIVAIGSSAQFNPELAVKPIIDAVRENPDGAPVIAFPLPLASESITTLESANIPCFGGVESCANSVSLFLREAVECFGSALREKNKEMLIRRHLETVFSSLKPAKDGGLLNEVDSNRVFRALGITGPRQLFVPIKNASSISNPSVFEEIDLCYPLVAKLVSTDLPHKTDYGAVVLDIRDRTSLDAAAHKMLANVKKLAPDAKIEGFLIQEMVDGLGEAIVGLKHDNLVGPIVTVGVGGILAEIYRDMSIRPAPVSLPVARQMIAEVKGFAMLRGYRGKVKGDLEALAKLIVDLSSLSYVRRICGAEINPVLVCVDGVQMLDAVIHTRAMME